MSDKSDAWEAHSESWDALDAFSRTLQESQGPEIRAFLHASQSPATHLLQKQGNRRRMIRGNTSMNRTWLSRALFHPEGPVAVRFDIVVVT